MLKLIEDKHTLTDPVYLKSAVSYDWEEFKELDKWEAVQRVVRGVKARSNLRGLRGRRRWKVAGYW